MQEPNRDDSKSALPGSANGSNSAKIGLSPRIKRCTAAVGGGDGPSAERKLIDTGPFARHLC